MDIRRKGEIALEVINEDLPLQQAFMAALATKLASVAGQNQNPGQWGVGSEQTTTEELTELLREQAENVSVLSRKQDLAFKVLAYELKTRRSVFQALSNPNESAQIANQIGVPVPVLKQFEHEIHTGTTVTNIALAIARYEAKTGRTVFDQLNNPQQAQQVAREIGIGREALQKFLHEVSSGNFQLPSQANYAGTTPSQQRTLVPQG